MAKKVSWSRIPYENQDPRCQLQEENVAENHEKTWSRKVFSQRAPMPPPKPSTNTLPTTTNSHTRSPRSVGAEMLERLPFSPQFQRQVAKYRAPSTHKTMLKSKRQYFPQQLTSGSQKCGCEPSMVASHPRPRNQSWGQATLHGPPWARATQATPHPRYPLISR